MESFSDPHGSVPEYIFHMLDILYLPLSVYSMKLFKAKMFFVLFLGAITFILTQTLVLFVKVNGYDFLKIVIMKVIEFRGGGGLLLLRWWWVGLCVCVWVEH